VSVTTVDDRANTVGERLQKLLEEVKPGYELDEEAAEIVLNMAEDFINRASGLSAQLAKHRCVILLC
jgi:transcription initiation factor TFIID subunit TAF12